MCVSMLWLVTTSESVSAEEVTAWEEGDTRCHLVPPDQDDRAKRLAASTINDYLRKSYNIELPISDDSEPEGVSIVAGTPGNNRMLAELETRQEQLLQARKMAAVGTFTSGVAHELNNPLNNIGITVETLLDDYDELDDDDRKRLLVEIGTQVERANATVRNLLNFARKD